MLEIEFSYCNKICSHFSTVGIAVEGLRGMLDRQLRRWASPPIPKQSSFVNFDCRITDRRTPCIKRGECLATNRKIYEDSVMDSPYHAGEVAICFLSKVSHIMKCRFVINSNSLYLIKTNDK